MESEVLIKINTATLPKVKKYSVARPKLYNDGGRNMAGELRTSYIGIFPKITVEFSYLNETEMSSLLALLDLPSFEVAWFDAKTQTIKAGTYYCGDFAVSIHRKDTGLYEPFSVNFIPYNKLAE